MNDLTTGGGISEALKRRYGIVDERPVQTMATDLFPVIDVADGAQPSMDYLAGVRHACGWASVAAVAGQYSGVYLRNPTGSNSLIRVRRWYGIVSGILRLSFDDPGTIGTLIGVAGRTILDTRSGSSSTVHQLPAGEIRAYATATPPGILIAQVPIDYVDLPPIVLVPGTAIGISPTVVNTTMNGHIEWWERKLEAWENFRSI